MRIGQATSLDLMLWSCKANYKCKIQPANPQTFDVSGVSEYTVASNMVRNRIFYIEIRSIEKDGNTPTAHCRYPLTYFGFAKYSKCK